MPAGTAAVIVGPFVAEAAANRLRPPIRLLGQDARGWIVLARADELLCLDEFGELWWVRERRGDATVVRPLWPEEARTLHDRIAREITRLRSRLLHPAGTKRRPR
jgi:hypothetical protein